MFSLSRVACIFHLHHWQYETKGHAFKGFVYPVSYRVCKRCMLGQVKIMDKETDEVVWRSVVASS